MREKSSIFCSLEVVFDDRHHLKLRVQTIPYHEGMLNLLVFFCFFAYYSGISKVIIYHAESMHIRVLAKILLLIPPKEHFSSYGVSFSFFLEEVVHGVAVAGGDLGVVEDDMIYSMMFDV